MSKDQDPTTRIPTSDMPSYEPTAEVPLRHRDNYNEDFQKLQESHNSGETATVPPEHRDDRHTITAEEEKKPNWLKRIIAGTALAATITAGAYIGEKMLPDSKDKNEGTQPAGTVSAPVDPSESIDSTLKTPQELIGFSNTESLKTLNTKPTQEIIKDALKPVTVKDYSTPEQALTQLGYIYKAVELSATVDTNSASEFPDTPESVAIRDELRANLYTKDALADLELEDENTLRRMIAQEFWYVNDSGALGSPKQGKLATWNRDFTIESIDKISNEDNTYIATVTSRVYTNIPEVDVDFSYRETIKNIDESRAGVSAEIRLSNDGKVWNWESISVIR